MTLPTHESIAETIRKFTIKHMDFHAAHNVEGHPAAENAGIQKEGGRGLDEPTCSMSSLWEWVRDAWSNGKRPVDKILKIAICVWLVNLAVHLLLICKVLINLL